METTLDDIPAEFLGKDFQEKLLERGAADVFYTPVQMKKGRPGLNLTVISPEEKIEAISDFILENTTTIGLRYYEVNRKILHRRIFEAETPYGKVKIKEVERPSGRKTRKFEYESLRELSEKYHISIQQLQTQLFHLLNTDL
ncbi:MAG: nickel insertion protein [Bacteroidia bacterium]|nr:nickel insertion protein [Bacteroidia bacterium]